MKTYEIKRRQAMSWWNNKSSLEKAKLCDTNTELVGHNRRWETLTGREIEKLYNMEEDKNRMLVAQAIILSDKASTELKNTALDRILKE